MARKILIAVALVLASTATFAQQAAGIDSAQTRNELRSLLRRYPPQLGTVLKLDPTLLTNASYMTTYPELASFAAQHPEIAHNPDFFLEDFGNDSPTSERILNDVMGGVGGFLVFLVLVAVFIWVIKLVVDHRRWNRAMEVNSKMLERFTSSEELLAYIQTPAGKRFLASAPIPLENTPRPVSAPIGRMFWSLQAGLVAIAIGIGFDLVSLRVSGNASQVLYGIGVTTLLGGTAFVISAIVFYVLSRRFGLLEPPPVHEAQ